MSARNQQLGKTEDIEPHVILHIGTLKTGTTSFQRWFSDHSAEITERHGFRWFTGFFPDARELAALCIDDNRETPAMALGFFPPRGTTEWESWAASVRANVAQQVNGSPTPIVVSCEALSLLRHDAELSRVTDLFPADTTRVVLCLRSPRGFLDSWKSHLEHDFFRRSNDPTSFSYVKEDSWLVDYESLTGAYRRRFGHDNVTIVDYDRAMAEHGSVVPALAATFLPADAALPEWRNYRLNKSTRPPRKPVKGLARPRHYLRYYTWKISRGAKRSLHRP